MTSAVIENFPLRLRELRIGAGLTQEEFAEKSDISYKYYQAVEAGRKLDLRLTTIVRFAEAHSMEPWELLKFSPSAEAPDPKRRVRSKKKR